DIKENTRVGIIDGQFANSDEVKAELKAESVPAFFNDIKGKIDAYYESN
ncbi:type I-B CRISPR-associated protein Cas7/Cst2/DevR, partial [Listeria monocytogenes]|nr:type I-B CRISPR-associated protein Cas7/Cst2/DevR [Listeria monocytogenes]